MYVYSERTCSVLNITQKTKPINRMLVPRRRNNPRAVYYTHTKTNLDARIPNPIIIRLRFVIYENLIPLL